MITSRPCTATEAPMIEKMSAWLDDVGTPKYQVSRSHAIAATTAATTRSCVTTFASTMPLPTVLATATPESAPTRLRVPAMSTAWTGVSTRVATTVAIAFAASWKPFTYSKTTPSRTTRMTRTRPDSMPSLPLGVLDLDGLDDVRDVLAAVERDLDERVNVLPLDDLDRVRLVREELGDGLAEDLVALVLEGVELDPVRVEILQALEVVHHQDHLRRGRHEGLGLPDRARPDRGHLVEVDDLRHVVGHVGHVVDLRGQAGDVLAVEGRDERRAELALDRVDVADLLLDVGEVAEQALERLRRLERVLRVLAELREEDVLLRDQG